jgi:single-strand DNA-binding protein
MAMSNPTYIKLTGWVTKDPELRKTNGDGTAVCTIRLGTAHRWPDKGSGQWREGPTSYFDVVCWRNLAMNAAMSLRKGQMVTISGTFRNRVWTDKENNSRTSLEITAHSVGHDLTYGVSHFARAFRPSAQSAEELAEGEINRALDLTRDSSGTGQDEDQAMGAGQDGDRAGQDGYGARWPGDERREGNPFDPGEQADHPGEQAGDPGERADPGPSAGPAYEPAGERVSGAGDEGDGAGTAETVADEPRLEEVAVPV